jgi:hypothetical protein
VVLAPTYRTLRGFAASGGRRPILEAAKGVSRSSAERRETAQNLRRNLGKGWGVFDRGWQGCPSDGVGQALQHLIDDRASAERRPTFDVKARKSERLQKINGNTTFPYLKRAKVHTGRGKRQHRAAFARSHGFEMPKFEVRTQQTHLVFGPTIKLDHYPSPAFLVIAVLAAV